MKILDRYIIRQFLINFGILLMVLMLLYVLVDLIVDLDEFLQAGKQQADRYGGVLPATIMSILGYYGPMMVLIYVFFSGLLVVGGMGFTLSALQRSRELTAVVASGISMYRIAMPMIVVGIGLNALVLPIQEFVIPKLAPKLARSKSQIKYDAIESFAVRFAPDEQGNLFSAAELDVKEGILAKVTIMERDERGLMTRRITADQALWDEQGDEQGWRLIQGYAESPGRLIEQIDSAYAGDAQPIDFFETELSPTVLLARRASIYPRLLSMAELQSMESNPAVDPRHRSQIVRIIWSRFSMLVVNTLILVMGLVFFLQLGQGNMLLQAMKAATICLSAWGLALVLLQSGGGGLNPVAAAWLPVVLLLPLSAALLQFVRT